MSWCFLLLLLLPGLTNAQSPSFSVTKNICVGVPAAASNASLCPTAATVNANALVYYSITITNPLGEPPVNLNLNDQFPTGFLPNPLLGVFCEDPNTTLPVTLYPPNPIVPGDVGDIILPSNTTVTCYISGKFTTVGPASNTVSVKTDKGQAVNDTVNTYVLTPTPLPTDLQLNKTVDQTAIDVSTGAVTLTYTITLTNNGPGDADIGKYFTLSDQLSLPVNGVPLNVSLISAKCAASSANAECPNPSGLQQVGSNPVFVPTSAPKPFFNWSYAAGQTGTIKVGETLTFTIVVEVKQIPAIACIAELNANGLRNTAFFTLNNQTVGIALNDQVPSNNTASVLTKVETGITQIEEGCGKGHLSIRKKLAKPIPGLLPWGSAVTYEITIKNLAAPAQPITISAAQLRDLVTEGINTPPFKRVHIASTCTGASCPLGMPTPDPTAAHTFYGDTQRAWASNGAILLNTNDTVTIYTTLEYRDPDCETVPEAPTRPIINTAVVTYQATPYGGSLSDPLVTFTQSASATVNMEKQPVCRFVVTKKVDSYKESLQFGNSYSYDISFTSNEPARTIGTLLEAIRIQNPGYSTGLPFKATWICTETGGVTGFTGSGLLSGIANYTTTPAMGAQLINLGSNVFFPQGATLNCHIDVGVYRPAFDSPFCTQEPHFIENLALMDVTNPFNNNIAWPPSGVYNPANASNPSPQDKNWATVTKPLPKCWDAIVNKTANVPGLPASSSPWTYVGGPQVNYSVSATNSTLGPIISNLPSPRWWLADQVSAPYSSSLLQQGSPLCTGFVCDSTNAPYNGTTLLGITSLAGNSTGIWNLFYPGPFTLGQSIVNCGSLGSETGGDFYPKSDPNIAKKDCVTVPVIAITKVTVTKVIVDKTGANQTTGGTYQFNVSCTPYAVPTANATFTLPTSTNGMTYTVDTVPVNSACTVIETQVVPPAATAQACGGASNVQTNTTITTLPNPLDASGNKVTVTNTFSCKNGYVQVRKNVVAPTPLAATLPAQSFTATANCSPAATPTSAAIVAGAQAPGTALFTAPFGANCTIAELSPTVNPDMEKFCASQGMGAPYWLPPVITPATVVASIPAAQVTIQNSWTCAKPIEKSTVVVEKKVIYPSIFPPITMTYDYSVACKYLQNNVIPLSITTDGNSNNASAAVTLLTGAYCIVKEVLPPFPPDYEKKYCPNGTLSWAAPIYSPSQPLSLAPGENRVVVTNEIICTPKDKGSVTIEKGYKGPQLPANILASVPFTLTTTCSNPNYSNTQTVAIGSSVNFTPPVGAQCTVTESFPSTPPAGICPAGKVFQQWNPPTFFPPMPFQVTTAAQTFKLVNTWVCLPIDVSIEKKVKGTGLAAGIPALPYTFNMQCPGVPGAQSTLTTNGVANNTATLIAGAWNNCSLTESLPTLTAAQNQQLCPNGTLSWATPVYTPPGPYNLSTGNQSISVLNELICTPKNIGKVTLVKSVLAPLNVQVAPSTYASLQFGVQANCTPGITTGITAGVLQNNSSLTFTPPVGASCSFTESFPPASQNNLCPGKIFAGWETPVFSPALPAVVGTNPQTIKVINKWKCEEIWIPLTSIKLTKVVTGAPAGYVGTYPITVNGAVTPLSFTGNGTASATVPASNPVTYSEVLPTNLPANCLWDTPVYNPPSGTAATQGQEFTVTNKMVCYTGKVTLNKVLQPPPGFQLSVTVLNGLNFGITANCTNPTFVASGTINSNGTYSISPPAGASCQFTETFPTLTAQQQQLLCPSGSVFDAWNAPSFLPSNPLTVTPLLTASGQLVQVNNSYTCKASGVDVKLAKVVIGAPATYQGVYNFTANTQNYTLNLLGNGTVSAAQSINVPNGAAFNYTENALPPAAAGCTWATPTYSPASGTIPTTPGQTFTVTNRMSCAGQPIAKVVQGAPANYQGSYNITVNGQTITLSQLGNGTQNGTVNLAVGAILNISEVSSPAPAGCRWLPPTYVPANGSANPGPAVALQVINKMDCTTSFTVKKEVTGLPQNFNYTYPISVNGQSLSFAITGNGQASQTVNSTTGQAMTYVEGTLPTPPIGCTWAAPSYNPPSGAVPANGQVFTVTNALNCAPKVNITLTKTVVGAPASYQASYPITVNGGLNNLSVTGNSGSNTTVTVLAGQAVNYVEGSLPAPPTGCTWATPTYSPVSGTIATAGQTFTVTNRMSCASAQPIAKVVQGAPANYDGWYRITVNGQLVSMTQVGNGTQNGTVNLAVGAILNFGETSSPAPAGCTWQAPIYIPANGTANPGPAVALQVINKMDCKGSLTVSKVLQPYTGVQLTPTLLNGLSFGITANCTNPNFVASGTINPMGTYSIAPPVGASCQFTETFPTLTALQKQSLCPQGRTFDGWNVPSFLPANPLTVTSQSTTTVQQVEVKNSYKCKAIG